ncbi:MAG: hypothetical protein RL637_1501 [Pseudomonadota bacterium]|jgi:signal peptidase II
MLKYLNLSIVILILDQISKIAVDHFMTLYESLAIMPSFQLTYVHNTGAAFSFLANAGGWQRWLFAGLAIVISVILGMWLKQLKSTDKLLAIALALVLGGAIGNLIDRLFYGYVIDFLDVYYQTWHWPAFNIADSAICIGVFLMLLDNLGIRKTKSIE